MQINIEIMLDNASFEDNPNELSQILDKIPNHVRSGDEGKLMDSNGTRVGRWEVKS